MDICTRSDRRGSKVARDVSDRAGGMRNGPIRPVLLADAPTDTVAVVGGKSPKRILLQKSFYELWSSSSFVLVIDLAGFFEDEDEDDDENDGAGSTFAAEFETGMRP